MPRLLALTALLVFSVACGRDVSVVGVDEPPWPDSGSDTQVDTAPPSTGGLVITYAWHAERLDVSSCGTAGVDTLEVQLTSGREVTVGPVAYPCADTTLRLLNVPVGSYELAVWGELGSGVRYQHDPIAVGVEEGVDAAVYVTLVCTENGVDDGCGGA